MLKHVSLEYSESWRNWAEQSWKGEQQPTEEVEAVDEAEEDGNIDTDRMGRTGANRQTGTVEEMQPSKQS